MASRPPHPIHVGCAGWSLRAEFAEEFGAGESHLARYSNRFDAVEINSTFKSVHRRGTFERWNTSVPDGFRFSVKVPKRITHDLRLVACEAPIEEFVEAVSGLGEKLGPILVQLPPSLRFDPVSTARFFESLRSLQAGSVVLEARHPSWFEADAIEWCGRFGVGRVGADPAIIPSAALPGTSDGIGYYRLHGAPAVYYSPYSFDFLELLAEELIRSSLTRETWCIFDNTALGHATPNALTLLELVSGTRAAHG